MQLHDDIFSQYVGAKDISTSHIPLNNSNALYDSPYSQYDQPTTETAMVSNMI